MLAILDIPEYVEGKYQNYKVLARQVFNQIEAEAKTIQLEAGQDLRQIVTQKAVVYILEGTFKLYHENRIVRFYSKNDFIMISNDQGWDFKLINDFAANISLFDYSEFHASITRSPETIQLWNTLRDMENSINLALCSVYMGEDIDYDFEFRRYDTGDIIITEEEKAEEIFELIEGEASVHSGTREIGKVSPGEIFGEISFLTEKPRTATIKANSPCYVRVIKKRDFAQLIKRNPTLLINMAKDLAQRVVKLNDRLVEVLT